MYVPINCMDTWGLTPMEDTSEREQGQSLDRGEGPLKRWGGGQAGRAGQSGSQWSAGRREGCDGENPGMVTLPPLSREVGRGHDGRGDSGFLFSY